VIAYLIVGMLVGTLSGAVLHLVTSELSAKILGLCAAFVAFSMFAMLLLPRREWSPIGALAALSGAILVDPSVAAGHWRESRSDESDHIPP
jgi:uncharacterized membrane protein YeaQ/YmgE (transglycosylase-associated protein family)